MKNKDKTKEQLIQELAEMRKRIAELEASDAELSAILANAPIIIMLVDRERRVKKLNHSAIEFTGRPPDEMIDRRSGEALRCIHSQDDPKGCGFSAYCKNCMMCRIVLDTLETGNSYYRVEAKLSFALEEEQQERYFLESTVPLTVSNKQMVLICLEDITERKQAEEKLNQTMAELEAAFKQAEWGIITLRGVAHNLKNVAMSISIYCGSIKSEPISNAAKEKLRSIQERAEQMVQNFQRLFEATCEPHYESLNLPTLMDVLTLEIIQEHPVWKTKIHIDRQYGSDLNVTADLEKLAIVFRNLIINACEAMEQEGGR